ncbi:hypothetical protein N781_09230 [Pontibacillus halophilus JSM 076056 = DSM 19796]|uniref:RNA 2',3'-cyclic phosphodiesterase n=1 Tax=Pontibacillus halophilus JSM 076056 = DSM 19796 TaxID=1385510 RepID=A0A0A5GDZ4_9BACI|nr:RNA 2',3'-cyclic phosphodiesterase [Pontibacillus halophilus]KGX89423.1 hypothetical protein N781_09230 [Pontibacillus halophilus JSM 076056 = DSM 19796]
MHYFIGIRTVGSEHEWLQTAQKDIKRQLPMKQFVHPEDFHITLKFLSECTEEVVEELIQRLGEIEQRAFALTLKGIGSFGNPTTPRVIWGGVEENEQLTMLHEQVVRCCETFGSPQEDRPYRPHITLAKRWGGDRALSLPFSGIEIVEGKSKHWVTEFTLFRIHPNRSPKYETVQTFQLQ